MEYKIGNINLSSLTNIITSLIGGKASTTTVNTTSDAIINPNSNTQQLTKEEQQIYELGEAEIEKLIEDYKKRNNADTIDMGAIGEIRTNYETGHPEYVKVLNKKASINTTSQSTTENNLNTDS